MSVSKNRNGKVKASKKRGNGRGQRTSVWIVPRSLGWAPERVRTNLRFSKFSTLSAGASTAANIRFVPTFLYDVDPTVGSTSVPGFNEWGSIYRFYRVNKCHIKASFANAQAFNVCCYICPVNLDPGANFSSTVAQQYLSSRLSKTQVAGPLTGNGQVELQDTQSTAGFGGASNMHITDYYSGSVSGGTPTNNWYWIVGVVGTGTVSTGIDVECQLDIQVEFYEIQSPAV